MKKLILICNVITGINGKDCNLVNGIAECNSCGIPLYAYLVTSSLVVFACNFILDRAITLGIETTRTC